VKGEVKIGERERERERREGKRAETARDPSKASDLSEVPSPKRSTVRHILIVHQPSLCRDHFRAARDSSCNETAIEEGRRGRK